MENENKTTVCAITTVDNPFDPIDEFDNWLSYDISNGYNTANFLANVAHTSDLLPNKYNDEEVERSIDEIVGTNPDFYKKIKRTI